MFFQNPLASRVPIVAQGLKNLTRNHEVSSSIPGLAQWVKDMAVVVSYGVGCRRGSDLAWLWLWHRLAVAAPIRPLVWEPPYATRVALKRQKKREREREN